MWSMSAAVAGFFGIAAAVSVGCSADSGESTRDSSPPPDRVGAGIPPPATATPRHDPAGVEPDDAAPSPTQAGLLRTPVPAPAPPRAPALPTSPAPAPPPPPPPAPPPPAPPPAAQVSTGSPDSIQRLVGLVNEERVKVGAGPLTVNGKLSAVARAHAESLAALGVMSHEVPGEPPLEARLKAAGYAGWLKLGENLAGGWLDPGAVVTLWLASPAHRANLLDPVYNEAGIGHAVSSEMGDLWVLDLGAR